MTNPSQQQPQSSSSSGIYAQSSELTTTNSSSTTSSTTTPTSSTHQKSSAVPNLPSSSLTIKSPPLPIIPNELLQALSRPPTTTTTTTTTTTHKSTTTTTSDQSDSNQQQQPQPQHSKSKLFNKLIQTTTTTTTTTTNQNRIPNELDLSAASSSSKHHHHHHQLTLPEFTPVSTDFNIVTYDSSSDHQRIINNNNNNNHTIDRIESRSQLDSNQSNPSLSMNSTSNSSQQSNKPSTVKNLLNLVNFHSNKPSMEHQLSPSSSHSNNLQNDQSNAHIQFTPNHHHQNNNLNSQALEHQSSQSSFILLPSTSQPQSASNQTSKPFPQFPNSDPTDNQINNTTAFQANQTMPHTPKPKETIWNKIGFTHTPFGGTSTSTSTGAKKLTLKQYQHHLADIPIDNKYRDPNHPHSASPLSSNYSSLASSSATRPRASFSLDQYIQSHLSSSHHHHHHHHHHQNEGKLHKLSSQPKSSIKDPNLNLNKPKPSESSLSSSKHTTTKSTDHLLETSTLPSPQLTTQSSIHSTQHSHQSSIDDKSSHYQNSSQVGNSQQTDWSSTNSIQNHQDEILEEDIDEVPWPRHENFTHHLQATHRRSSHLKEPVSQHAEEDEEEDEEGDENEEEGDEEEEEEGKEGNKRRCLDCALDDCKAHSSQAKPHARRMHLSSTGSADSPHIGQYLQLEHPSGCTSKRNPSRLPSSKIVNRLSPEPSSCSSNSLPFRIGKGLQQATFDQPYNSLRNRRILDPLEMRFKANTEPIIKSTPTTGKSTQSSLYQNTLEVPHTAPIGGFPDPITASSISTSATANLTSPGSEETDRSKSPRVRSLSDTLVRRAKQFHKIHHQLQYQYPTLDRPHLDDLRSIDSHHLDIFNGHLKNASALNDLPPNVKQEVKVGSDGDNDDDLYFIDTPASRAALASKSDFTIGVAGPKGVGKSTIITRALRKPVTNSVTLYSDPQANKIISYVSQVTNGNAGPSKTVQVLEVDQLILSERFIKKDHNKEGMNWPKRLPALDGILLCYDAMDPTALDHLRPLLHSFWTRGGISLIVLACKSNKDEKLNLTSPIKAAELVNVYGTGMIQLDGGLEDPGKKMRNSFNWIMKAIREARGEPRSYSSASTHILESGSHHGDDQSPSRSSSDLVIRSQASDLPPPLPPKLQADGEVKMSDTSRSEENAEHTGETDEKDPNENDENQATTASFGTMSNDATSRHAAQKAIVMSQRGSEMDLHLDKQTIIHKFVFATVSGNEPSFVDHFLIVFRRFSTPFDVLSALINRFEFVSYHLEDDPLLTRYAQMKICHVLMTWVEAYPGDFVKPSTLQVLKGFTSLILSATWLLHYAVEILPMTKTISSMVDEDIGWALPDTTEPDMIGRILDDIQRLKSSLSSTLSPSNTRIEDDEDLNLQAEDLSKNLINHHNNHDTQSSIGLKSQTASSSIGLDSKAENKSLLDCSNQILGLSDEALALQITRLEWDIFAEMKPRHLIRYVLAPRDPKNPRVALRDPNSPIARSTDYLNHLAAWASSMILIQDKLKSRARVLLKLMRVAYELRDMDDFHSLMGVLAGIEAQPVYRLEATFEIVQHMDLQSYRRYLSLKRLMSSQRSFSAYRLARQTASAQCVPYLGTYLQDITAVNEVKDDMRDGKVNWTKFGQIAKACSNVIECGKLAPEIEIEERIEGLIMRSPILSEDSQYALSYKWKHRAGGSGAKNNGTSGAGGVGVGSGGGGNSGVVRSKIISTNPNSTSPLIGGGGGGGGVMTPTNSNTGSTGVAKKGTRKLRQLINTAIH